MIDLRRLQVLRAVHHHGTVTAAAEALHLTPSAVSQQIRQLARDLGVELLRPEGRCVRLTPAARVLLGHADALHQRWEEALADIAAHTDGTGPLRMCGYPTALATLIAPATGRLRRLAPEMTLRVCEAEEDKSLELLLNQRVDIAVMVPGPDFPTHDDTRFEQHLLLEEPQDLVVPGDHPLATRSSAALVEVCREPWITSGPGLCHHARLVSSWCAAAGFTPHVAHEASDWIAATALVEQGLGISLIPRLLRLPAESPAVRVPVHGPTLPTRAILACVRAGSANHPAVALGLRTLREVVAERVPNVATTDPSVAPAAERPALSEV